MRECWPSWALPHQPSTAPLAPRCGGTEAARVCPRSHPEGMLNLLPLHLTKLLFPKFTPFDLASDGFGQLGDKLHLGEEKANHPESCCHFLPVPTPPFTLHVPHTGCSRWWSQWWGPSMSGPPPDPLKLAAAL